MKIQDLFKVDGYGLTSATSSDKLGLLGVGRIEVTNAGRTATIDAAISSAVGLFKAGGFFKF